MPLSPLASKGTMFAPSASFKSALMVPSSPSPSSTTTTGRTPLSCLPGEIPLYHPPLLALWLSETSTGHALARLPLLAVVGSMAALPALRPWALKTGGAGRLLPTSTHVERGGGAASTLRANATLRPRWLLTTFGLRPRPRLSMRLLRLLLRYRPSLKLPTKTWMLSMR